MKTVVFATAHRLAAAVRRREVSAADVIGQHLDRIHSHHPRLNVDVARAADGESAER